MDGWMDGWMDGHDQTRDRISQRRFKNTFEAVFKINYGQIEESEAASRKVRKIHSKINGQLFGSFPFPEGSDYNAHHEAVSRSSFRFDLKTNADDVLMNDDPKRV